MVAILVSTWKSGLRSRYFHGVFFLSVALIFTAYFSASFSPRAPRTVALDVGLSGLRISLVLLGLFWVQEMLAREIDRKTVMLWLTYPVSRGSYLFGRWLGICSLGLLAAAVLTLALMVAVIASGSHYEAQEFLPNVGFPLWVTAFGVWLDAVVVIAFCMAMSALSTTPLVPLAAGAAFAIAGKALGPAMEYLLAGNDPSLQAVNKPALIAIHWFLPDLSRLDWRLWPMYQLPPDWAAMAWAVLLALADIALFLVIAIWAFSRREFA